MEKKCKNFETEHVFDTFDENGEDIQIKLNYCRYKFFDRQKKRILCAKKNEKQIICQHSVEIMRSVKKLDRLCETTFVKKFKTDEEYILWENSVAREFDDEYKNAENGIKKLKYRNRMLKKRYQSINPKVVKQATDAGGLHPEHH